MSAFDPETGLRVMPAEEGGSAPVRRDLNPYDRALTIVWLSAGLLGVAVLLSAGAAAFLGDAIAPLVAGGALLGLTAMALVGQLTARSVRWRPTRD